jgi:hypothetical protein
MGMGWLFLSGTIALIAAVAVPLDLGRRDGRRWGIRRKPREVDPSPYRGATVHEESERGAPFFVRFAAGANVGWGLLTMLVFAPAGCLLLLLAGEAPVLALLLPPIILSGFLLSFRLMGAAGAVLQNRTEGIDRVAVWSVVHHGVVALFFAIGTPFLMRHAPSVMGLLPAIPAAIGLSLALMLRAAARRATAQSGSHR